MPCVVYGLATADEAGAVRFFFVGGLRRTPGLADVREHIAIMRELQPALALTFERFRQSGVRYGYKVLAECAADEARDGLPSEPLLADQIRWQIIRLVREGHPLINERLGTPAERARLAVDVAATTIQSAADLARRRALLRRRATAQERRGHVLTHLARCWHDRRTRQDGLELMLRNAMPVLWRRLMAIDAPRLPARGADPVAALHSLIGQAREACPHRSAGVIAQRARRKPGSARIGAPPGVR
jgi:hypothetical protein